jgi:hypothetical protein
MRHLQKIWIRIIASLIGGGMIIQMIGEGDPSRYYLIGNPWLTLLCAVIVFLILTAMVSAYRSKSQKKP